MYTSVMECIFRCRGVIGAGKPSVVCLKNFSEICMMSVAQAIGKIEIYEAIH